MQDDAAQWLTAEEGEMWRSLISVADRLISVFDNDLERLTGLSWHDYGLLVHLSEGPGSGLRIAELAESMLFASSRINRSLDSLAERGWAWRESRDDGHWAGLTDTGRDRLASAAPLHLASVRNRVFDRLDGDLQPVLAAVNAIADGLDGPAPEVV